MSAGVKAGQVEEEAKRGPPEEKGANRDEDKPVTPLLELPMPWWLRCWACLSCAVEAQTTPRPRGELPPHPSPLCADGEWVQRP